MEMALKHNRSGRVSFKKATYLESARQEISRKCNVGLAHGIILLYQRFDFEVPAKNVMLECTNQITPCLIMYAIMNSVDEKAGWHGT